MESESTLTLWALFTSAFVSSTVFPGGSEVVLGILLTEPARNAALLISVATVGNTLGAMTSWGIGRFIALRYPARNLVSKRHRRALDRVRQYGSPALLLSWLPIVGDPLCVAAGWLRVHWLKALILIATGKGVRYVGVLYLVDWSR